LAISTASVRAFTSSGLFSRSARSARVLRPSHLPRSELKRELARLGLYKGPRGDTWDGRVNMAVGKYLGQGG
jgi:hypothetical protein